MRKNTGSAVARVFDILSWFSDERPTGTVTQLSTQLRIPKATTYRILSDSRKASVVEYDSQTKLYRLGPRVLEFSRTYSQSTNLVKIARPYVTELRDKSGETVSLNVMLRHERICVEEARSLHQLHWSVPPGTRGPLYAGSGGKVILAFIDPKKLMAIKAAIDLKPLTPDTPTDWNRLADEFEQIREVGYCLAIGEVGEGVGGLAAPILDENGFSVASINISGPLLRWSPQVARTYIPLIKEYSQAISKLYQGSTYG